MPQRTDRCLRRVTGTVLPAVALTWMLVTAAVASDPSSESGAPAEVDALVADSASAAGGHEHRQPIVLAPGYADLTFEPPAAGSYRLPALGTAADGAVLDDAGRNAQLHELMGDRLVLLSFIYTTCSDVNGCPLATHVFGRVADRIAQSTELAAQVRLISMSFDPDHDSPEIMRAYAERHRRDGVDWQFLTTASIAQLDPTLDAYGQWVIRDYDAEGNPLGTMSHLLRVYLIDRQLKIRNIYSVSFLHADTIANDIQTLLLQTDDAGVGE